MSEGTPIKLKLHALDILSDRIDSTPADQLIANFHAAVDKISKHTGELFPHDRTCSIEFEGNDLLAILAQDGARNIRFYFALHVDAYTGNKKGGTQGQINPHLTLVAVGIDDQGNEMRPPSTILPPQVPAKVKGGQKGPGILFEFGFPCPPDC